ncbi:hypothetical protein KQI63_15230 [bacterium]|nr:hypothetical protein [bacterium]
MKRTWIAFLPLMFLFTSCVNEELTGTNDTGPGLTSYYPLSIDNSWTYQSYEIVDGEPRPMRETQRRITGERMHLEEYGAICVDSIGIGTATPAERYIMRRNEGVYHRVTTLHFEPVVNDDWGPWYEIYNFDSEALGARWREIDDEDVTSYWELESISSTAEVPAGTFTNCCVNTWRSETSGVIAERKHYFVLGVGEVLEEVRIWESGSLMLHQRRELVSYDVH